MPAFPSLSDYSQEELVFMCDEHDDEAFGILIERHPAMKKTGNFFAFLSGVMNPFGNMVFGMHTPEPEVTVEHVTKNLKESKAPAFWWVGPCTEPTNIGQMLEDRGWKNGSTAPCMVVDLANLQEIGVEGLQLKEVTTNEELTDWQEVFARAYGLPIEIGRIIDPVLDGRMRLFTALIDGEPVGTTGLFVHKGVPGIYCVSTMAEYRRRGIGAAITAMPLLQARDQGYKIATLQASSMGYPVYKRLGFRDVCDLKIYTFNI